jgi:5-methylcytosine-specific restriction endonuclease McrA
MSSDIYDQVNREFACDHEFARLTYLRTLAGHAQYRKQCQQCGEIIGKPAIAHALLSEQEIEGAIPFDRNIGKKHSQARNARFIEIHQETRQREQDAWWERYDAYLRSPEWQARRRLVLARDPMCGGCGVSPSTQVHHLSYQRVGREMLFELVGVCEKCHAAIHPHLEDAKPKHAWDMRAVGD